MPEEEGRTWILIGSNFGRDGHPVVVYPGLAGGAMTTAPLRRFLYKSGFTAHDWEGGINTGPQGEFEDWLAGHIDRVGRHLDEVRGRAPDHFVD